MGTALVVGAGSAIGTAVAVALAEAGHEVVIGWGRSPERLRIAAEEVGRAGAAFRPVVVDVRDPAALREAADAATRTARATPAEVTAGLPSPAGDPPLTTMVWAAGVFDWAPAHLADADRWSEVIDVTLTAAATTTALVLPALVAAAPSTVVYVGSLAGRRAFAGNAAYVAAKHGLAGLAHAVFEDVRELQVKVCLLTTGMVAAGASLDSPAAAAPDRLLRPGDVADAVRYVLASRPGACPVEIALQPQHAPPP